MFRRRCLTGLTGVLLTAAGSLACGSTGVGKNVPDPTTFEIDLAYDEATTERELPKGTYDVVIRNAIPGKSYRVSSTRLPDVLGPPPQPSAARTTCTTEIDAARDLVATATREEDVPRLVRDALAATPDNCRAVVEIALCADTMIARNSLAKVERGSVTTVKVRRVDDDRTWVVTVRTGQPARWAVLPLTGAIWTEGEEYFAEPVQVTDDEGNTSEKFKLVQEDDEELAPMAGIAVLLLRETKWPWPSPDAHGPFVGIGFTTTDPPVGLTFGYGLSWRDHVALTVGGALVQERHLLGRYEDDLRDGTLLDTNLTNDQLTEPEAEFRILAGLAISFGGDGDDDEENE